MIFAGKCIESIAYCREYTYFYRKNPNGIMNTSGIKRCDSMCIIIDDILSGVTTIERFFDEINYVLSHIAMYEGLGYAPLQHIKHKDSFLLRLLYRLYPHRFRRVNRLMYNCGIMLFWTQLRIVENRSRVMVIGHESRILFI